MLRSSLYMLMGMVFALSGCGGSGIGNENDNAGTHNVSNSGNVVDTNFTIDLAKVPGYDQTDPINDQYLAVINYLRDLSIKCDDAKGLSGPVGTDMQWEDHLAASAKEHSEDMKLSVWYGHDGSGTVNDKTAQDLSLGRGSQFNERIEHNGYTGNAKAENIATMMSTPNPPPDDSWVEVMEGWIKSKHGHCSNIMNPKLTDFGMYESRAPKDSDGVYKVYWTQDFGGHI